MAETFDSWAILELMGHVRMAGRVTEEERFGCKMGRIDVPHEAVPCRECNGTGKVLPFESGSSTCPGCEGRGGTSPGFTTVYFGGSSVYRMTPTTEEIARAVAAQNRPAPVHRFELRQLVPPDDRDEDRDVY